MITKHILSIVLLFAMVMSLEAVQIRDRANRRAGTIDVREGLITYRSQAGDLLGTAERKDDRIIYKNSEGLVTGWAESKDNFTTYYDFEGRAIATAEVLNKKIYYRDMSGASIGSSIGSNSNTGIFNKDGNKLVTIEGKGVLLRPIPIPAADKLFGCTVDFDFKNPPRPDDPPPPPPAKKVMGSKKRTQKNEFETKQDVSPKPAEPKSEDVAKTDETAPAPASEITEASDAKSAPAAATGTHYIVSIKEINPGDEGDIAGLEVGDIWGVFGDWNLATATGSKSILLKNANEQIELMKWVPKEVTILRKDAETNEMTLITLDLMAGELGVTLEANRVSNDEYYGAIDKLPKN